MTGYVPRHARLAAADAATVDWVAVLRSPAAAPVAGRWLDWELAREPFTAWLDDSFVAARVDEAQWAAAS